MFNPKFHCLLFLTLKFTNQTIYPCRAIQGGFGPMWMHTWQTSQSNKKIIYGTHLSAQLPFFSLLFAPSPHTLYLAHRGRWREAEDEAPAGGGRRCQAMAIRSNTVPPTTLASSWSSPLPPPRPAPRAAAPTAARPVGEEGKRRKRRRDLTAHVSTACRPSFGFDEAGSGAQHGSDAAGHSPQTEASSPPLPSPPRGTPRHSRR